MENTEKPVFYKFSKKVGVIGRAIFWCLAERGSVFLDEVLSGRSKSLGASVRRINSLKTVEDYYEILSGVNKDTARVIIWRLIKKGLIRKENGLLGLTSDGETFYERLQRIKSTKSKWDGKFRIIMFDVPEGRRKQRDFLRSKLLAQEYAPLQKSVFIGKYPLAQEFVMELMERDLYRHLRMLLVGEIDDDETLEALA